jgi:hypothetical protein
MCISNEWDLIVEIHRYGVLPGENVNSPLDYGKPLRPLFIVEADVSSESGEDLIPLTQEISRTSV